MQRLIELFIDTNTMEFYNRDGALGASTPSISAGELVQLKIQLCNGAPEFDETGAVTNPDTRFAGTLAAGEFVVDNNYNWYDPITIMDAVTAGSAIETIEIQCTTTPRPLGTIIIAGTDYVNYCEAVKTETGYLLTLADAEFSPASFTPSVNCDAGSAARNLERPVIVSAQNDSTGRETGLFTGLLDAANPVYESMIEGNQEISGTILEVNIYDNGRSVFRARFEFDCLGAVAASSSAGYIKSNVWTEADSRYIRRNDWTQPDEYQFSADGSTEWHDTQTDNDAYIRIRRPGGEWGQAIKLPASPQGPSGSGSGDMLKSVYDTDNDGKVAAADEADSALNVGGKTASQVAAAVDNSHTHSNKTTLEKLGESGGKLTFDGAEVGGGGTAASVAWENVTGKPSTFPPASHNHEISDVNGLQSALDAKGTVKSVNGAQPDGEGNVTIETGGSIDESRLLPDTAEVSSDSVGNPVIFKAASRIDNTYWLCLPFNEDTNDRSTYGINTEAYGTVNIVSNAPSSPGGSAFFNGSSCLHGTLPAQFGTADFTVRFWMMAPEISGSSYPSTIFSTRKGELTSGDAVALHGTNNGKLFIYSNTYITSNTSVPSVLKAGTWHHIAVVRKSGVATLYVDGNVYASGSLTNSLTRQAFSLGALWDGSNCTATGTFYMASLDVLNYAAYDGAFTVPSYQPGILTGMGYAVATDNELKGMLSVAGIDESRLLPENPQDGDVAIYSNEVIGVNYNDNDTIYYINASSGGTENLALAGVSSGFIATPSGMPAVEDGAWHITDGANQKIIFAAESNYIKTGSEFTLDFYLRSTEFTNSSRRDRNLFTDSAGNYLHLTNWSSAIGNGDYGVWLCNTHTPVKNITNNVATHIAIDVWYEDSTRKWAIYVNGVVTFTGNLADSRFNNPPCIFGSASNSQHIKDLYLYYVRISKVARYKGNGFVSPDASGYSDLPYGQWSNQNLNTKIDEKIATHNSALNAHPMQFSGETDFNNLTQGGSFYLSAGDNLQNAPATGTFFVIIKNWTSGDITRIFQQVYRLQPGGVHRLYTRHGNKASGAAEITWSSWMMIGYNAFISAPKYNSGTNVTSSYTSGGNSYACSSSGWMYLKTGSGGSYTINGGTVVSADASGTASVCVPVKSGDVVSGSAAGTLIFYPQE